LLLSWGLTDAIGLGKQLENAMSRVNFVAVGLTSLFLTLGATDHADAQVVAAAASSVGSSASSDDGARSLTLVRNTSAVAAGLIALALGVGMNRLRKYGVRRTIA
jgi:hypothetical protein